MADRVSTRAQLAIGLAAMAATASAIYPARSEAPRGEESPAAALSGSPERAAPPIEGRYGEPQLGRF